MTIRSLTGLLINEVLDATARNGSSELRKRIDKIAKQKLGEGEALLKLQAFLERARNITNQRNKFMHSLWAHELDGSSIIKDENHNWGPIPNADQLQALSEKITQLIEELNDARLHGFLHEALKRRNI